MGIIGLMIRQMAIKEAVKYVREELRGRGAADYTRQVNGCFGEGGLAVAVEEAYRWALSVARGYG